jgi:hypothetical protein
MATQIKTLVPANSVTVLIEDGGKMYARIVSGNLDGGVPASIPSPATYYGKFKYNQDVDFEMDDTDDLTDSGGVAYWGVTLIRRK